MVKDLYCIFSMFDMTVQIQTEDKTIDEKIPLNRAVETITDFCRSRHRIRTKSASGTFQSYRKRSNVSFMPAN